LYCGDVFSAVVVADAVTGTDALCGVDAAAEAVGDLTDVKHVEVGLKPVYVGFAYLNGPWHVLFLPIKRQKHKPQGV
tara:strand:- start:547 stop:777 length:231 start_codon:yes stop_codon:yes gene_type:complete